MPQVVELLQRRKSVGSTLYLSHMHEERTQVEVFTRVPDYHFRTLNMGRMSMIAMRCGTVSIRREANDIRTRPKRISTFLLQIRGRSAFHHYGNRIELGEGDITLCDNSAQYNLSLTGPNEMIMFRVPNEILRAKIPSPEILCGRRLARNESLASTACAMARDFSAKDPRTLPSETAERAGQHLLDVLTSSYLPLLDERESTSAIMSGRFWKVKLFIEEHLRDPELSPSFIASNLRLSDRYLRMIFAVSNESPSAYILRRRLEECAAQLRDPHWRHYSITNIAFSWGFNSAPHFARSFRARYLCSPRDYRHKQLP